MAEPEAYHPLYQNFLSAFQSILDILLEQLKTLQLDSTEKSGIAHSINKFLMNFLTK